MELNLECIAFYNLENLFDTISDPDTNKILQEDFTPLGKKNYNSDKYFHKDQPFPLCEETGSR